LERKTVFTLNAMVRIFGALILTLFLFAGCDEDEEGPTGSERLAWDRHEPLLEGNKLRAAVFADENNGWFVGLEGVILNTSDGGDNWSCQQSGTNENLWEVTFYDADTGWAVGENGSLLRTTDGGLNWTATLFDTITGHIYSVAFEDGRNGWGVGEYGTIVRTTDGGRRWARDSSGTDQVLRGVSFFGNVGLAVGDAGTVLRTTKDTEWSDWSVQTISTDDLLAVTLVNSDTGWAVGENGAIWVTTDSGITWSVQNSGVSETLTDVVFADALTGIVVGSDGIILSTSDGGGTWVGDTSATWHDLYGVCFAGATDAWAVGSLEILRSTNSSDSWSGKFYGQLTVVTVGRMRQVARRHTLRCMTSSFSTKTWAGRSDMPVRYSKPPTAVITGCT